MILASTDSPSSENGMIIQMGKILIIAFALAMSAGALPVCADEKTSFDLFFLVEKEKKIEPVRIEDKKEFPLGFLLSSVEMRWKEGSHLYIPPKVSPRWLWKQLSAKDEDKEKDGGRTVSITEFFTGPSTVLLTPRYKDIGDIVKKLKFENGRAKIVITVTHPSAISERLSIFVPEPPK